MANLRGNLVVILLTFEVIVRVQEMGYKLKLICHTLMNDT